MHKLVCNAQLFNSSDVSMLGHGCGVSQYPQFYDEIKKYISHITTSACGKLFIWKGSPIFAQTMDYCISQISWNIYYGFNKWHTIYKMLENSGGIMDKTKDKIMN